MSGRSRVLLSFLALFYGALAGAAISESDQHFLAGYQAYLDKSYGECADEIYKVVEAGGSAAKLARPRLYLAFCQTKLGLNAAAAVHLREVSAFDIQPQEKEMLVILEKKLRNEIAELSRVYYTFYPYGGGMTFSPGYNRKSASFIGLYVEILAQSWKFTLGMEKLSFTLLPSFLSFVQVQSVLGIQKTFSEMEVHAKGIYLYGDTLSQDSIRILGLGVSSALGQERATRVYVDGYYSYYPNSLLGPLTNIQLNLALEKAVTRSEDFEVWVKLGSQTIVSSSPLTTDAATGFERKPFYERVFGELNFKASELTWGGSAGVGGEAFGIRNEGAVVYSAFEYHALSFGAYLGYVFSPTLSIKATYSHEEFFVGPNTFAADTIFGLLAFTL